MIIELTKLLVILLQIMFASGHYVQSSITLDDVVGLYIGNSDTVSWTNFKI